VLDKEDMAWFWRVFMGRKRTRCDHLRAQLRPDMSKGDNVGDDRHPE